MTKTAFVILLAAILAYGLAVRLYDLTADSPAYFGGGGQDLTTDGPYLTLYAKSAVQHHEWNPLGYAPWAQFKISAVSAVSYLLFLFLGVSRFSANLTGVLLSVVGIVLFLLGLSRTLSRPAVLVAAALLSTSYLLVLYGRVPLAENGLICLAGAAYLVFSFWFDRAWGKVLLGILIALVALLGKTFGFVLVIGPLVYLLTRDRKRFLTHAAFVVLPMIACTAAFSLLSYRGSNLLSFLYEHGVAEHGIPYGLTSPLAYIETVVAFGRMGIYRYAPVEGFLAFLMLVITLMYPERDKKDSWRTAVFMIGWLVVLILVLAPFNYRPVRYSLPLILPMAALAGLCFDRLGDPGRIPAGPLSWWRSLLLLAVAWHFCFAMIDALLSPAFDLRFLQKEVWYSLPVAALLTSSCMFLNRGKYFHGPLVRKAPWAIGLCTIAAVAAQWHFLYPWYSNFTHTIDEANRDMPVIVSPSAVIAGQYGPALSQSTSLRGFPLFITPRDPQVTTTLRAYPITHIAVPAVDWDSLVAGIPELKQAPIISRYWLRDGVVYLLRVAGVFNKTASGYQLSRYEQALDMQAKGDKDGAMHGLFDIVKQYPFAKSPSEELYYMAVDPRNLVALRPLVDSLVTSNASDFTVNMLAAIYYKYGYQVDPAHFPADAADTYRHRATELSPANEAAVNQGFRTYTPSDRVLR